MYVCIHISRSCSSYLGDGWQVIIEQLFYGVLFRVFFKTAQSIIMEFPSSIFFMRFVSILMVHQFSSTDTATVWKKFRFILSES